MSESKLVIEENVPLAGLTTLRIGGPARYYARATSVRAVQECVAWAGERGLPLLVLGGGSNMLIADSGFPGLVLHMDLRGNIVREEHEAVFVTAGAGEDWSRFVDRTVENGWAGIECLAGIPGMVGASPIQNIGAYGQEVGESIATVEVLDRQTGEIQAFHNAECGFGYRSSRFKSADPHRYIVLRVTFRLIPGGDPTIRYAELERRLALQDIRSPVLIDVRKTVLELRRSKSMLLDEADPNTRSAGSFFVNPVISERAFNLLRDAAAPLLAARECVPGYAAPDGWVKVPAAWLIERAGFIRGYACGNVGISSQHTLALINRGHATAREMIDLARRIRDRVHELFGVVLVSEPVMVGVSFDEGTQPGDADPAAN